MSAERGKSDPFSASIASLRFHGLVPPALNTLPLSGSPPPAHPRRQVMRIIHSRHRPTTMNTTAHTMHRRDFLKTSAAGLAGLGFATSLAAAAEPKLKRKFTLCLAGGMIGVSGDARKVISWASQFGFESIEPPTSFLAKLSDADIDEFLRALV